MNQNFSCICGEHGEENIVIVTVEQCRCFKICHEVDLKQSAVLVGLINMWLPYMTPGLYVPSWSWCPQLQSHAHPARNDKMPGTEGLETEKNKK